MKRTVLLMLMLVLSIVVFVAQAEDGDHYVTNSSALAKVYGTDYGYTVWRWNPEYEQGAFTFAVSFDEVTTARDLAMSTGEPVLVEAVGDIGMWALASGECQVNSPRADGQLDENIFPC